MIKQTTCHAIAFRFLTLVIMSAGNYVSVIRRLMKTTIFENVLLTDMTTD